MTLFSNRGGYSCHWHPLRLSFVLGFILSVAFTSSPAVADDTISLTQIISRENPALSATGRHLAVGRDGLIYIGGGVKNKGYVLRVAPDGSSRFGSETIYALTGVAANADGIFATSNAHYAKSINVYDPNWQPIGKAPGFTGNDTVTWNGPGGVETGDSGDFFGLDQHANRVVRVTPTGSIASQYTIDAEGKPGPSPLRSFRFRVCEKTQSFYYDTKQGIRCADFAGNTRWTLPFKSTGYDGAGFRGAFDVNDDGTLLVIDSADLVLKTFDTNGKAVSKVTLLPDQAESNDPLYASRLRTLGDELLVQFKSPMELFRIFDPVTGQQKRAVHILHEKLTVNVGGPVWTAGIPVPIEITLATDASKRRPLLRAWLRPLHTIAFDELTINNDQLLPPQNASGLYHLKITSGLGGDDSEYTVQTVVEIRQPNTVGTVSIFTPSNRYSFGRGESISATVQFRTNEAAAIPEKCNIQLQLRNSETPVWQTQLTVTEGIATLTIPPSITDTLIEGQYRLTLDKNNWTIAPQYLVIGRGMKPISPLSIVEYGDYKTAYPKTDPLNTPEKVARHIARAAKLGINLFVDRLGHGGAGKLGFIGRNNSIRELNIRLANDPLAVAHEKAKLENALYRSVAAYSAEGIEQQAILLYMDAGLPIGRMYDPRTPEDMSAAVTKVSEAFRDHAAFRGWSWAANWWYPRLDQRLELAGFSAEKTEAYKAALKAAREDGVWDAILDEAAEIWMKWPIEAEQRFDTALQEAAPGRKSVMTAPYRQPLMIPTVVFTNADEIDLHWQGEQIQWPQTSPFNVDFYKRPGKRAWAHPELTNDDGTGGMIQPTLMQLVMRGADGIGHSGNIRRGRINPADPRNMGQGGTSVARTLYNALQQHAELLTSLKQDDPIIIPVSTRMMKIEDWGGIGGWYFTRIFEASQACLYAHRPARIVFVDDMDEDALVNCQAVLIVSQGVEPTDQFRKALQRCRRAGTPIYHDATSREEWLEPFGATPLDIAFDRVQHETHTWQDDSAFLRFTEFFTEHAAALTSAIGDTVKPIAQCANPQVMLTEAHRGDQRVLFAVNNTFPALDPAIIWRVGMTLSTRLPVVEPIKWNIQPDQAVVELLTGKRFENGELTADLRTLGTAIFVTVPKSQKSSHPTAAFGSHLRDIVVQGDTAVVTAANWDQNLFGINLETGAVRWQQKVGHHFTYAPSVAADHFMTQAFDLNTPEGYHLYRISSSGHVDHRFALYGLPKRATRWATASTHIDPINQFAHAPDGSWVASAGDLGLVVWAADGRTLWRDDWWQRDQRKRIVLFAASNKMLLTLDGPVVTAYAPASGSVLWQQTLGRTGNMQTADASADARTLLLRSTAEGGRLYVLRDGKLINTIAVVCNEVSLSPDGQWIVATQDDQLNLYHADGGLRWSMTGDDALHYPRFSRNNRIACSSEIGTLYVLDTAGTHLHVADLGALPVARWLDGGDLLVGTWMGKLTRLDDAYHPRWSVVLSPNIAIDQPDLTKLDDTPTTRIADVTNAAPDVAPLEPNLITTTTAFLELRHEPYSHGDPRHWSHDVAMLHDGNPTPPSTPWLNWADIGKIDSGWREKLTFVVDTFRTQVRLTGITIAEDPAHPESWQRDMLLQYWDTTAQTWRDGPYLVSNQALHTHWFEKPIEAAKFRFVTSGGGVWPYNNFRFGEIVFHGEELGPSHADILAKRAVAVLFDEDETDLRSMIATPPSRPFAFKYDDAYAGGKSIALTGEGHTAPHYRRPFGHTIPHWNFPIVENPQPGQYRWLQFAWKALSDETRGIMLHVGPIQQGHAAAVVGERPQKIHVRQFVEQGEHPPKDWQTVRIDLWALWEKPFEIRSLALRTVGGGAAFDQIVLAATEADLDALKK